VCIIDMVAMVTPEHAIDLLPISDKTREPNACSNHNAFACDVLSVSLGYSRLNRMVAGMDV